MGISSARDFLGTTPSYTLIRDPILRPCHRLIACSIAGKSQVPEKVTMIDLFYLRGMDIGSVNIPYLLDRYLRLFAAGRKSEAHISVGQFVARLADHFGLLTEEILGGLSVIAPELLVIDMAEMVRLQLYVEIDGTWAWVASRPERQPDAAAGAPAEVDDVPVVNEGGQADPAPVQAPQQPPPPPSAPSRTMVQRLGRLEEDVQDVDRYGNANLDSKRRALWSLIEDNSKNIDLKTNTPYPSRRYGVSVPALTKDHQRNEVNTPYPEDSIRRIQEKEYNILEDIKRGPYFKKSPIRLRIGSSAISFFICLKATSAS
ncbi:hypothetical protein Tco_1266291 [Tanacetum coccineum]